MVEAATVISEQKVRREHHRRNGSEQDAADDSRDSKVRDNAVQEPMDLLQMSLSERVLVKMRHGREVTGKLVAYDDHLNLMLSDSREKVTEKILDPQTQQTNLKVTNRDMQIVYVRGDLVVMVSPQNR